MAAGKGKEPADVMGKETAEGKGKEPVDYKRKELADGKHTGQGLQKNEKGVTLKGTS